jgi:hypothetical protein
MVHLGTILDKPEIIQKLCLEPPPSFAPEVNEGSARCDLKSFCGGATTCRRFSAGPQVAKGAILRGEDLTRPTREEGHRAKQLVTNWIISYYAPKDPLTVV